MRPASSACNLASCTWLQTFYFPKVSILPLPRISGTVFFVLFSHRQGFCSCAHAETDEVEALCRGRQLERALDRLEELPGAPSNRLYFSLLRACVEKKSLSCVDRIRVHIGRHKINVCGSLGRQLVLSLAKCGALEDALDIFHDESSCRSVFTWTAIISAFVERGLSHDALIMYKHMQEDGVEPDDYTFVSLLKACGNIPDLSEGKNIHSSVRQAHLEEDVFVGTTLVSMYGKCGDIEEAENVFVNLSSRNLISWNAMLSAYVDQGLGKRALLLYYQMNQEGIVPNCQTILVTLQACGILAEKEDYGIETINKATALAIGQALHANARRNRFTNDDFVSNTLVSFYGKCGTITYAEDIFRRVPKCSVVSWTALISSYVEGGQGKKALQAFLEMHDEGMAPNQQTFVSALQACSILQESETDSVSGEEGVSWEIGQSLHADVQKKFYTLDAFVMTTLVGMYGSHLAFSESENVFSRLPRHTILQWNAMLSTYIEQGKGKEALLSYRQLIQEGMCPNQGTFVVVIQACTTIVENNEASTIAGAQITKENIHEIGRTLHSDAKRAGFASDLFVGTTLVSMYGKCGTVMEAENVFYGLSEYNTIAWNAMLSAYADQGQGEKALHLYEQIRKQQAVVMNDVTTICVLQACSETGCVETSRHLHFLISYAGYDSRAFVVSSLINAYGCCASMCDSWAVFLGLADPGVAAWNSCISGYAGEGDYAQSHKLFVEMHFTANRPDGPTFMSLISACSHAGLLRKGIEFFVSITEIYGMKSDSKHYVGMVDLLGRAGGWDMVEDLLRGIPDMADISLWLCLLGACRAHGNVVLGKHAFDNAVRLQPMDPAPYVLMSNICCDNRLATWAGK